MFLNSCLLTVDTRESGLTPLPIAGVYVQTQIVAPFTLWIALPLPL
jgi:hypothetical protein